VRQVHDLEAAGQAFRQSSLNEQRRGSEEQDLQRPSGTGVGVPQALHSLRPMRHLLNFVQHEERAALPSVAQEQARRFPLRIDPGRPAERGLVRAGKHVRQTRPLDDLGYESCLSDLPRPSDDLHEAATFAQAAEQLGSLRTGVIPFAHDIE
jgi:hypothetical protein